MLHRLSRSTTEQVTELKFTAGRVTHALMPPHEPDTFTSISAAFSIGISFTGHTKAVIERGSGRRSVETFAPGTCGITGEESVKWLRVAERSEALMIYPSEGELASVSTLLRAEWQRYGEFLMSRFDPFVWSVGARFRMAALRATPISDLEVESLLDDLLAHVAVRYFGAQPIRRVRGRLHPRRLARATEFIESRLANPPSLREMSAAAAMSAYHFQRSFRATLGLTPYAYLTARRMDRARRMLHEPGSTVAHVATKLGFSDVAHFRRLYRKQFNASPRGKVEIGEVRR